MSYLSDKAKYKFRTERNHLSIQFRKIDSTVSFRYGNLCIHKPCLTYQVLSLHSIRIHSAIGSFVENRVQLKKKYDRSNEHLRGENLMSQQNLLLFSVTREGFGRKKRCRKTRRGSQLSAKSNRRI